MQIVMTADQLLIFIGASVAALALASFAGHFVARDVADRTARVVFGEVDFDMKRGGAEGFAFKRADTFLDRVNDDFGFHFHDWISLRPMN